MTKYLIEVKNTPSPMYYAGYQVDDSIDDLPVVFWVFTEDVRFAKQISTFNLATAVAAKMPSFNLDVVEHIFED